MYIDFSAIDTLVEKHSELLVKESKELKWEVINLHKKAYFDVFQHLLAEKVFWTDEPDSFKVAACLIASLIEKKPLRFTVNDKTPPDIILYNYRLAVNVALDFLSTTTIHTYTKGDTGKFEVDQKHPTVKLKFPSGIIEAEEIYTSLCKSLAFSDYKSQKVCASSISIILHLLYCYCSEKENENLCN